MPRCPRRLNSSHARPGPVRRRLQQAVAGRGPGLGWGTPSADLEPPQLQRRRRTSSSSFSLPERLGSVPVARRDAPKPPAGHWPVKSLGPLVLCSQHPDPPYRHAGCSEALPAVNPPTSLHTQMSPLPRAAPRPFCPLQQWPALRMGREALPPFWKESRTMSES